MVELICRNEVDNQLASKIAQWLRENPDCSDKEIKDVLEDAYWRGSARSRGSLYIFISYYVTASMGDRACLADRLFRVVERLIAAEERNERDGSGGDDLRGFP